VAILNARELVESLVVLPGVRSAATDTRGIERSVIVNGIEIAQAGEAGERQLRAAWRRRAGGGSREIEVAKEQAATDVGHLPPAVKTTEFTLPWRDGNRGAYHRIF
jgi:hypothetical protein